MAKCIVCASMGMDTTVDEARAKQENLTSEYQGRTYYFDSLEHKNMFDQDPERYLKIAKEIGWAA
ncbi:MAG: YHS domain-containing protein [Firmicutes bacterium]|nr:YHS domain-containing protein [Bacillota bacterium]